MKFHELEEGQTFRHKREGWDDTVYVKDHFPNDRVGANARKAGSKQTYFIPLDMKVEIVDKE